MIAARAQSRSTTTMFKVTETPSSRREIMLVIAEAQVLEQVISNFTMIWTYQVVVYTALVYIDMKSRMGWRPYGEVMKVQITDCMKI